MAYTTQINCHTQNINVFIHNIERLIYRAKKFFWVWFHIKQSDSYLFFSDSLSSIHKKCKLIRFDAWCSSQIQFLLQRRILFALFLPLQRQFKNKLKWFLQKNTYIVVWHKNIQELDQHIYNVNKKSETSFETLSRIIWFIECSSYYKI